jgi:DNA repair exonuclease SbcCD ATPase subunit
MSTRHLGDSAAPPSRVRLSRRLPLGELMVRERLITAGQLDAALREQSTSGTYTPLGQVLVAQRAITQDQLNVILDRYHKKDRLGDILVETNVLSEEQLRYALEHQKGTGARLGEILVGLNLVTEVQMKEALSKQFGVALVELDGLALDPSLAQLINRPYAEHHGVIPIAKTGGRLTVAMLDPAASDVVDELRASTGCSIEIVTSTSDAIQRAFTRLYQQATGHGFVKALMRAELEHAAHGERQRRAAAESARAVTDFRVDRDRLLGQYQEAAGRLRDLEQRQEELFRTLDAVHAQQDGLLEREHHLAAELGRLAARQETIDRAVEALLKGSQRSTRRDRTIEHAVARLGSRHEALRQRFAELEAGYSRLRREQETLTRALAEERERHRLLLQDREDMADKLHDLLRLLKR